MGIKTTSETTLGKGLESTSFTTDIKIPSEVDSIADILSSSRVTFGLSITKVEPDNLYRFLSNPVMRYTLFPVNLISLNIRIVFPGNNEIELGKVTPVLTTSIVDMQIKITV